MPCDCNTPKLTTSRRLYLAAVEFIGTREVPGKGTNPLITSWIKQSAQWLDGDDSKTAWCGCFRGHLGIITGTGVPRDHYRAASWAKWGEAIDVTRPETWEQGDTIVMTRPGGNHVCLFDRLGPKYKQVNCLGGNQADAVNIASFSLRLVTHVRRLP